MRRSKMFKLYLANFFIIIIIFFALIFSKITSNNLLKVLINGFSTALGCWSAGHRFLKCSLWEPVIRNTNNRTHQNTLCLTELGLAGISFYQFMTTSNINGAQNLILKTIPPTPHPLIFYSIINRYIHHVASSEMLSDNRKRQRSPLTFIKKSRSCEYAKPYLYTFHAKVAK